MKYLGYRVVVLSLAVVSMDTIFSLSSTFMIFIGRRDRVTGRLVEIASRSGQFSQLSLLHQHLM